VTPQDAAHHRPQARPYSLLRCPVDADVPAHSLDQVSGNRPQDIVAQGRTAKGKPFLDTVRRWVASHYDPQQLERELQRGVNAKRLIGTATVTPYAGLGRYTLLDEITTAVVRRALGSPADKDFQSRFYVKLGEVVELAEALATVVDDVFGYLVVEDSTRSEESSVLRVDPLIARARRQLQKAREARP